MTSCTHSYAFRCLEVLDRRELSAFDRFLRSPLYNYRDDLPRLLKILRGTYPEFFDEKKLEKWLFSRVYPGKKFQDRRWRKLVSDFHLKLEEFLHHRGTDYDLRGRHWTTCQLYLRRGHLTWFDRAWRKFEKACAEAPLSSDSYEWTRRGLQLRLADPRLDPHKDQSEPLAALEAAFAAQHCLYRLKMRLEMCSRSQFLRCMSQATADAEESRLLEESERLAVTDPLIRVYAQLYRIFRGLAPLADFENFLHQMNDLLPRLAGEEAHTLLQLGINFCNHRHLQGDQLCRQYLLELVQIGQLEAPTSTDHVMPDSYFINTALLLMLAGQSRQLTSFRQRYGQSLPADTREATLQLIDAYHAFREQRYQEAWTALTGIDSRELRFALRRHSLRIRVAVELFSRGEMTDDLLMEVVDDYDNFFRGRGLYQLSPQREQSYRRLGQLLRRYAQLHLLHDRESREHQFTQLLADAGQDSYFQREWLLEKLVDGRR